jgi:hypothetical protein
MYVVTDSSLRPLRRTPFGMTIWPDRPTQPFPFDPRFTG